MSPDAATIDAALVRCLLAEQFPDLAGLPVEPALPQGWDNRTFRIGTDLAARLPSAPRYVEQVAKEWRWLPLLAPQLPLSIPEPVALGRPGCGYPFAWSLGRWRPGTPVAAARIADPERFARDLAAFLVALRRADAAEGPAPGTHNFFRGAPPAVYAEEVERCFTALAGEVDVDRLRRFWDAALASRWDREPVWFHGDVAAGNLLLDDAGQLAAVLDFGSAGVGDPACDLVIAWTVLPSPARPAFRRAMGLDDDTWRRGRGWLLWKALLILEGAFQAGAPPAAEEALRELERVLSDDD